MTKGNYSAIGILLIVAMTVSLAPQPVSAQSSSDERPIRLYTVAQFSPIGMVRSKSFGAAAAAINGRVVQGEQPLWGGELVEALRSTQVSFDTLGNVALNPGAAVRFGAGRGVSGEVSQPVLVASLERGSMGVELQSAEAYVESGGSVFTASRGANFSVRVVDGRASVETFAGAVRAQDPTRQDVNIRIVDELGRPVASGSQLSVRSRSTRQIQVQVTDKNDKPLPDLPVLFSLGDPCLGSLGLGVAAGATFRQKTDKRGIAAVPLTAGAARCAASILAKVEGTNASVSIQTNVVQQKSFFNTRNNLIIAGLLVAGVIIGFVVANQQGEPIRSVPPPQIKP